MIRSELRTLVWQWLDDVDGGYFTATVVNMWLNLAQREVQKRLLKSGNNFYLEEAETTLVANQADYVLPIDFIKLHRLEVIVDGAGVNENRKMLEPITFNQQGFLGNQSGEPEGYSIKKNRVTLYPTPDRSLPLRLAYSPRVEDMTSDSDEPDVPEDYHELVAIIAAENGFIKDDRAPQSLLNKKANYERMMDSTADERREDAPRMVVISDDGGW